MATTEASSSRSAATSVARTSATGDSDEVPVPIRARSTTRPSPRSSSRSALGERVDDGDEGGAGVLLARLGGGEVQPAEGAVLRVRERLQRAVGGDPGQRQALGVDELGLGGSVGQVEGDDAPVLVESGERGVGAGDQELQVVELGRRRAVLDHPRILSELR